MALTAGTTAPMVPYSGVNSMGQSAQNVMTVNLKASQTVAPGDILVVDTGTAAVNNTTAAPVLGVAYDAFTSDASPGQDEFATICPATSSQIFIGSLTTSATVDLTAPAFATHCFVNGTSAFDTAEDPVNGGYPVIIAGASAQDAIHTLSFAREQLRGQTLVLGASGTTNPRIYFTFALPYLYDVS